MGKTVKYASHVVERGSRAYSWVRILLAEIVTTDC